MLLVFVFGLYVCLMLCYGDNWIFVLECWVVGLKYLSCNKFYLFF